MDERKYCERCKKWYYPKSAWIHASCKDSKADESGAKARGSFDVERKVSQASNSGPERASVDSGNQEARKQRWSREAYNAYMREYMRKRRK